jgi:hypothetical protein
MCSWNAYLDVVVGLGKDPIKTQSDLPSVVIKIHINQGIAGSFIMGSVYTCIFLFLLMRFLLPEGRQNMFGLMLNCIKGTECRVVSDF